MPLSRIKQKDDSSYKTGWLKQEDPTGYTLIIKHQPLLLTRSIIINGFGLSLKNGCPDQGAKNQKYAGNPQQSYKS